MNKITRENTGTNQAIISGELISEFSFSHEMHGEEFYTAELSTKRLSGICDIIPVMVSDRLVDVDKKWKSRFVRIRGQFRSRNKHEDNKSRLILYMFAKEFEFWTDDKPRPDGENQIILDGHICKTPICRETPLGKTITDLLLAVNRPYGKTDYIPLICWDSNAVYASNLQVGDHCVIFGRIQSREYTKKLSGEEMEKRVAYEVSVSILEVLGED